MIRTGLGCTRFSQSLQKQVPVQEISDKDYFSWYLIDYRISVTLSDKGYEPHVHGEVEHLHYSYAENPAQISKETQLKEVSLELTRKNPSAVLAHVGMDIKDGIDRPTRNQDAFSRQNS
jgi:hypothetical protein